MESKGYKRKKTALMGGFKEGVILWEGANVRLVVSHYHLA